MRYILIALFLFGAQAFADGETIDAKTLVEIDSFDPKTRTYELVAVEFPGQGPLVVTSEELARIIPTLSLDRLKRDPEQVLHNQYTIDKQAKLLTPEQVEKRKQLSLKKRASKRRPAK
jgi:hypothetical protein